jgi:hypothetical protein
MRWAAFLSNHREAIAAMDFFTVPTCDSPPTGCYRINYLQGFENIGGGWGY